MHILIVFSFWSFMLSNWKNRSGVSTHWNDFPVAFGRWFPITKTLKVTIESKDKLFW